MNRETSSGDRWRELQQEMEARMRSEGRGQIGRSMEDILTDKETGKVSGFQMSFMKAVMRDRSRADHRMRWREQNIAELKARHEVWIHKLETTEDKNLEGQSEEFKEKVRSYREKIAVEGKEFIAKMERYKKEGNSTGMYDEFPGMRRWAESRMESVRERRRGQIGDGDHRGGKI